jgi:hexulose-6-phosphate isomerase
MQFEHSLPRREFLQASAAGIAAGVAAMGATGFAQEAASERQRSNRGRIYKANKGGGIAGDKAGMLAKLTQYKQLGFDGIEGGSPDIKDIPALQAVIAETGVPVHGVVDGVHWGDDHRLSSPNPTARERGVAALIQAIKDSKAIGGSTVLLVPGKVTGPEETHDHVWERSIVEIRKALPAASHLGIRVLIENVWNGFCETPEQYRDYIDAIDSPWVGAYFDIGNCRKFGPAEDWIRTLGTRIVKLDVKDWGQKNSFCRLGEGDVNWPEVRRALAEVNFTGWATREGNDKSLEDTAQLMDELLDL